MEVEHFCCKKDFPTLVMQWTNLLPACKRCNGKKGDYNVVLEGMIAEPFSMDPKQHFYFQNYRLRWKDNIGRRSIDVLHLNDTDRLVSVRLKIGETVAKALETIRDQLETYISGPQTTRRRNQVIRGIEKLLKEAHPKSEFSALVATLLLNDTDYIWIKQELVNLDLWQSLSNLEISVAQSAL